MPTHHFTTASRLQNSTFVGMCVGGHFENKIRFKRGIVRAATSPSGEESAETRRLTSRKGGKNVTDLQQVPGVGPRNEALLMSKGKL